MRLLGPCLALATSLSAVNGLEMVLDQKEDTSQHCAGMYGRKTWGGPVDPFILVKYLDNDENKGKDLISSLVIFEWKDRDLVGIPDPDGYGTELAICDDNYVNSGKCNSTSIGEFIISPEASEKSKSLVLTRAVNLNDPSPINYSIKKTGYYCIVTAPFSAKEYTAVVEFRNAYGELPATQIPKLPFYGGITILYALLAGYWAFLYYQHRHDILAVQNYITAILVFLVIEMLMTWGFFDYLNRNGANVGSKVLMIVVGILNAARNSFSFFLLLIVCMGYGVVKHTLGRTMIYVRWLAAAHFVFGIAYAITGLLLPPEEIGPLVFLIVLPLVGTLTAFYIWTLNSLNFTLKDLRERKQHVKESMYRKLWWAILLSIIVIFAFFFFNSFTFASVNDPDFVPFHWKTRWFILDGWLNIVYFVDVAWVAYLWRPTAHNRRFAMSDEIAQDDDGNFEIADIGVPDDSDDEELQVGKNQGLGSGQLGGTVESSAPPQVSGIISESSRQHRPLPRDSGEGETLFAVGEDGDKFSDEGSDNEDAKLVRNK